MTHRSAIAHQGGLWSPPASTVALWYGDLASAGYWLDRTANGNDALLWGDAALDASDGLALDGSGDFCKVPSGPLLPSTADFTVVSWVNRTSSSAPKTIFAQYLQTTGNGRLVWRINAADKAELFLGDVGAYSSHTIASTASVGDGWHMLAATRSGGTYAIYVGTSMDGTLSETAGRAILQRPNLIGARSGHITAYDSSVADYFTGKIGYLLIASEALDSDISAIFAATKSLFGVS